MPSRRRSVYCVLIVGFVCSTAHLPGAQAPSPALLVVLKDTNSLAIVDLTDGRVAATVSVGEGPHEVTTDGTLAYVSNHGETQPGSSISVIDLAARRELRRIDIGPASAPHSVHLLNGKVYFTAEGYKAVGRYDPTANRIDWFLGTGQDRTHMLAVSRDGHRMFTANMASDTVTAIDGASSGPPDLTVTAIPVGRTPEAIDISPDGREVWVMPWRDEVISIIDTETKTVVQRVPASIAHANRVKFTPDGRRALISDISTGELIVMDTTTRKEIRRLRLGNRASGIVVAPDGLRAYVALNGDGAVAEVDLETLDVTRRIPVGRGPDGLALTVPSQPPS